MRVFTLVLILFSASIHAGITVSPQEMHQPVQPGDLVDAQMTTDDPLIALASMKALLTTINLPKKVTFVSIRSADTPTQQEKFKAKVVFGPDFNPDEQLKVTVNGTLTSVEFKGWLWNPQIKEVPKEFDYEKIPLLSKAWWIKNWPLLTLFALVCLGLGAPLFLSFLKRKRLERKIKERKQNWLSVLASAKDLEKISDIWRSRDEIRELFHDCQEDQRQFFDILNQYQFKPTLSQVELEQVTRAKEEFLAKLVERQRGV